MSEKPFWAGKTLMEIQNLDKRVKVTMENGDVFIGKLVRRSRDTDGIVAFRCNSTRIEHIYTCSRLNHLIRSPSFPVTSIPSNCWMTPTTSVSRRLMTSKRKILPLCSTATATRSQMWKKAVTDSGVGYTALSGRNVSPLASTPSPTDSVRSPGFLTSLDCGWTRTITHG